MIESLVLENQNTSLWFGIVKNTQMVVNGPTEGSVSGKLSTFLPVVGKWDSQRFEVTNVMDFDIVWHIVYVFNQLHFVSKMWYKINYLAEFNRFEFWVLLLLDR